MHTDTLTRCLFSALLALAVAWGIYWAEEQASDPAPPKKGRRRYAAFIPITLPLLLPLIAGLSLVFYGRETALRDLLTLGFPIFLSICVYDACLLPALPLLRRRISAQTCALLWLLPNYLYIASYTFMELSEPRWVVVLPAPMAVVGAVWIAGACAVLGWKVVGHLRFRRRLLRRARLMEDPEVLALWREEQENAGFPKARFPLLVSPAVSTPLSVGLFSNTIRVVLPERAYTAEDLRLVLRHELVHISRADGDAKFFLVFCTALCWFNPLMWLAMERSAQDLELSCDETVLLGADEVARRRYAELLLSAAGDGRGFTTCLSASASALRYRLRSVLHPAAERRAAAALVGVLLFALLSTAGWAALVLDSGSGRNLLFPTSRPEDYTVQRVAWRQDWESTEYTCTDGDALTGLLGELELGEVDGNYATRSLGLPRGDDGGLIVEYAGPGGSYTAVLETHYLELFPDADSDPVLSNKVYHLKAPADWEAVFALLTAVPGGA